MPKISVIVPVYNVEPYLRRCIDSILAQTFTDFELILVDDGSPDNCGAICDEYATKDSRIGVIHKGNGGVSSARNAGLDIAKGKYIGFVDGDDFIKPDAYQKMFYAIRAVNADIVYCEATFLSPDGSQKPNMISDLPNLTVLTKDNWTPRDLLQIAGSSCHCMYSAELIRKNKITFPNGLVFSEDRVFNFYAMGYAQKTLFLKESYYYVCLREGSCIQRFHPDYFENALRAAEETEKAIRIAWNDNRDFQLQFLQQFVWASAASVTNWINAKGKASLKTRYHKIKEICSCPKVHDAILATNSDYGIYCLIIRRRICLLLAESVLPLKRIIEALLIIRKDGFCIALIKMKRRLKRERT